MTLWHHFDRSKEVPFALLHFFSCCAATMSSDNLLVEKFKRGTVSQIAAVRAEAHNLRVRLAELDAITAEAEVAPLSSETTFHGVQTYLNRRRGEYRRVFVIVVVPFASRSDGDVLEMSMTSSQYLSAYYETGYVLDPNEVGCLAIKCFVEEKDCDAFIDDKPSRTIISLKIQSERTGNLIFSKKFNINENSFDHQFDNIDALVSVHESRLKDRRGRSYAMERHAPSICEIWRVMKFAQHARVVRVKKEPWDWHHVTIAVTGGSNRDTIDAQFVNGNTVHTVVSRHQVMPKQISQLYFCIQVMYRNCKNDYEYLLLRVHSDAYQGVLLMQLVSINSSNTVVCASDEAAQRHLGIEPVDVSTLTLNVNSWQRVF